MSRSRRTLALLLSCSIAAGLLANARNAEAAATDFVQCGHTVNVTGTTVVLANNLKNCPGNGIVVSASNVTVDLNGHRISGVEAAGSAGIRNDGGHPGLTIRGGAISDFERGIITTGTSPVIKGVVVTDHTLDGISVTGGADGRVERNTVARNGDDGIVVAGSNEVAVVRNTTVRNGDDGIEVGTTFSPSLIGNRSLENTASGVFLNGISEGIVRKNKLDLNRVDGLIAQLVTSVTIDGNRMIGNDITGIRLNTNATGNTVFDNRATGNGQNGIVVLDSSNLIRDNNASANSDHGIWVTGGLFNVIRSNVADENGVDGIQLSAPSEVVNNHVHGNGWLNGGDDDNGLGIDDDAGSTGSGNSSAHNDDFDQCEGSVSCIRGSGTPPGVLVTCGAPITRPIRLRNNLENCGSEGGLVISDSGVDVNLGGHRIDGNFAGFGISSTSGHSGTTIRNGVIGNFQRQVHIGSGIGTPRRITIKGIYATDDDNWLSPSVINLEDVDGGVVSNNVLGGSGGAVTVGGTSRDISVADNFMASLSGGGAGGLGSTEVKRITIKRNTLVGSGNGMFVADGAESVRFSGNRITGVVNAGIGVTQTSGIGVSGNSISGSGTGVWVLDTDDVSVAGNIVRSGVADGIVVDGSTRVRVTGNSVAGNHGRGVLINNGSTAVVRDNRATANGSHGIDTVSAAGRIYDNVANANGFISAPGAPADGGGLGIAGNIATRGSGNRAKRNDDPAQCSPGSLC